MVHATPPAKADSAARVALGPSAQTPGLPAQGRVQMDTATPSARPALQKGGHQPAGPGQGAVLAAPRAAVLWRGPRAQCPQILRMLHSRLKPRKNGVASRPWTLLTRSLRPSFLPGASKPRDTSQSSQWDRQGCEARPPHTPTPASALTSTLPQEPIPPPASNAARRAFCAPAHKAHACAATL